MPTPITVIIAQTIPKTTRKRDIIAIRRLHLIQSLTGTTAVLSVDQIGNDSREHCKMYFHDSIAQLLILS